MGIDSEKRDRLDVYLTQEDLEAVWFARPSNFAWLTGGSNVVDREPETGEAAVGYDGDELTVITTNIEAPRLADEQLNADTAVESFPWFETSLVDAVADRSPTPAAADFAIDGMAHVGAAQLRIPLTDPDIERYRTLGTETAAAVESVAFDIDAEDTERAVAARLREELFARGIDSPVVLVAGAERAQKYRHFPATDTTLDGYALLSVTGARDGLHASTTRTVAFDPPEWLKARHETTMTVDAAAIAATSRLAGAGTASDVFSVIQDAYADAGYPDEWRKHHQGGAAGFAGREWKATPTGTQMIEKSMAYAWNPTVEGAKSEDTVLVADDTTETLTTTGEWPTHEIDTGEGTVVRHAIGP